MRGHLMFAHKVNGGAGNIGKDNVKYRCPRINCHFETSRIQALYGHLRFAHNIDGLEGPFKPHAEPAEKKSSTESVMAGIGLLIDLRLKVIEAEKIYNEAKKSLMARMSGDSDGKKVIAKFVKELKLLERGGKK